MTVRLENWPLEKPVKEHENSPKFYRKIDFLIINTVYTEEQFCAQFSCLKYKSTIIENSTHYHVLTRISCLSNA